MFSGRDDNSHGIGLKRELEREHESDRDFDRSYDNDPDRDPLSITKDESTMDYEDDEDRDERPSSADQPKDSRFNIDMDGMSSDSNIFMQRK